MSNLFDTLSGPRRPPRALLVIGGLGGGGAERIMSGLTNAWAAKGWNITMTTLTADNSDDFYLVSPVVKRLCLSRRVERNTIIAKILEATREILLLRGAIKRTKPDFILSFLDITNVMTIAAALGTSTRVIVSERIDPSQYHDLPRPWALLRHMLYPFANLVVVQTESVAKFVRATYRCRSVVIPNFIRSLPSLSLDREPLVLSVGRLEIQKDFKILIRAFAEIHNQFPHWRLQIIGAGPEQQSLLTHIAELGLKNCASILPPTRDIESWMARAGIFVLPSRCEGFPNVLLEAMGMGAPVISTDCPSGPAEIIREGFDGYLVPVGDIEALSARMKSLMSNQGDRTRLGNNARKVQERFSEDRIIPLWESVCLMTVAQRATHGLGAHSSSSYQ